MNSKKCAGFLTLMVAIALSAYPAHGAGQGNGHPVKAPSGTTLDRDKPVKVYILMGQSNMVGFGRISPETQKGTLEYLTKNEKKYPYLLDAKGNWNVRQDVWCVQVDAGSRKGWLQPGFGARSRLIGPELGFGYVMGSLHDEAVLIIKASMGNRCLGWDILPPSSWTPEQKKQRENPEKPWYPGWEYDKFVNLSKEVLKDLPSTFPTYKDQGYEIAGFGWWQGHKDQKKEWAEAYERNLTHLIRDLRKDFNAPKAPFVLATIAFGADAMSGTALTIAKAQLAVSNPKKYPEFAGNVKTVDARKYWRDADESPSNKGYHYNHNAATYMDVGLALGQAMADMKE